MTPMTPPLTLVVGSTGKTGRRVAERLAALGLPVRAGSRHSQPPFDWEDPTTWATAVDSVDRMYLTYYPDIAMPGAIEAIDTVTRLAVERGVRRIVLLSGRGEPDAKAAEDIVRASGVEWTVVRCAFFAQNFSESFLADGVRSGVIALPAGSVAEPILDVDDIADVVVAALTGDAHVDRLYELTGPRLLTFAQAAAEISAATDREVRYVPVTADEYRSGVVAEGLPPDFADMLTDLFTVIFDGRNESLSDGVQRALGREPRDFADFAARAAGSGVWVA
ncbi:MAG: NmrA family NAD(P)-binding protein [Candidatus Nanopelagicales bacterium]